ncbi:hypothetical protein COV61_05290 [Candidatus Micrarchaeota archaeon CG11_big_fil_rev_8_21_14_0_20_47_5]|nr:MAG: hypothetical protein AUJ17_01390 [Candidatus Micrarchaeota archaeon CG1_02_47_40]PIN82685.1 MAG: hypothetical protein COV61_05290 [Candidatus Micrarchaeota archaeon CG11_big_fil_rev_8_21_14_0_20_47_5]
MDKGPLVIRLIRVADKASAKGKTKLALSCAVQAHMMKNGFGDFEGAQRIMKKHPLLEGVMGIINQRMPEALRKTENEIISQAIRETLSEKS